MQPNFDFSESVSTTTAADTASLASRSKPAKRRKRCRSLKDVSEFRTSHIKRRLTVAENVISIELRSCNRRRGTHQESTAVSVESIPLPMIERGSSTFCEWFLKTEEPAYPKTEAQREDQEGDECYSQNRVKQALSHYRRAHALDPKEPIYALKMAASLKKNNRAFESRQTMRKISTELNKEIRKANQHQKLGKSYLTQLKQYGLAIEEFSKAIELDPSNPSYWAGRCDAYLRSALRLPASSEERTRMYDLGILDAVEALKLDPKDTSTWNRKGCCHSGRNQKSAAVQAFSEAVRLSPNDAVLWVNRADTLMMDPLPASGPPTSALQDINQALKIDSHLGFAWRAKGDYWTQKGNKEAAKRAYRRALKWQSMNGHGTKRSRSCYE
eukprot:Protomagalhaensia_wolfi_Nauph_80__4458@NODE_456_length_2486_cov_15_266040_g342_i0_p1_GENE_NODE_456_length_2486_cov_15_266040_g342_i0NODE_456_length_2486_cov_15_266040_g342_i0_p1_ORF_typecomplete_len385_score39_91TPR_11/PF13414_6/0_0017TPR_11/PF13414_6/5_8e08TPR_11/PF13414_6/41TPR_11/PF13414_6/0_00016TPR_11/PF13414_6/24TPR_11/PF13414_6/18TPR_16/PF13432_6/0_061TPR_16/PF13432_6/0_00013TPR_16/PF13432_6/9_5e05TPR_16/PF13432_6/0_03TPR_16/PF13432_6/0_00075TPR_19/PF14559_6/0_00047TPR_19/PF14559_6/0_0001